MSGDMPRSPVVYNGLSRHRRIPVAGNAFWFPLLDDLLVAGIEGVPPLVESGTPSGSKWGTKACYTFATANTDNGLKAVDDIDDLYIDSQLSLIGMEPGQQFITALEASYTAATGSTSSLWTHGKNNGNASLLGLALNSGEVPQLHHRAKDQSTTGTTDVLTEQGGTFVAFRNQGLFALVLAIRPVSASAVDIELRMSNGTLTAHYALSGLDVLQAANGGTALPGHPPGLAMASFGGFCVGHRLSSSDVVENCWGRGDGNVGKIGNVQGRKYNNADPDLCADVLAQLLAHPHDFVLLD